MREITLEAEVWSQCSSCWICGGQIRTGSDSFPSTSVIHLYSHSTNATDVLTINIVAQQNAKKPNTYLKKFLIITSVYAIYHKQKQRFAY